MTKRTTRRKRAPGELPWEEQLGHAIECDDRPIVGVVALDPAGETGDCGLVVWGRDAWRDSSHVDEAVRRASQPAWWVGNPMSVAAFQWLGTEVAGLCPQATRVLLVAESDAFGPSVARKLGIGIGGLQGLLLDLNAISVRSRVDVASVTWRAAVGVRASGRDGLKARACKLAAPFVGGKLIPDHAAEALQIGRAHV